MSIDGVGINNTSALKAYQAAQNILKQKQSGGSEETSGASGATGGGFGDVLSNAVKGTINTVNKAEQISADAIAGKASLTDVVTAVNSADIALKTVVAIRDKAIGSYQDIMRMQI